MTNTLKKIDGVYHARVQAKGQPKWVSTGCDNKPEAEAVLKESGVERLNVVAKAGRLTARSIGQILTGNNLTMTKALEKYAKVMASSKSPSTIKNNLSVVGNWVKEAHIETLQPSSVTAHHIDRWINSPTLGWRRNTRHAALGSVRGFFEFCSSQGWIVSDPSRQVALDYSAMTHEQKEATDKKPFTEAEVKYMVKELTDALSRAERKEVLIATEDRTQKQIAELQDIIDRELFEDPYHVLFWLFAVRMGAETGLRLSDIAQLEWRSLAHEEIGKVIVWMEKTNQRIEHSMSDGLQKFISEIPVMDADYVFPKQRSIIKNMKIRATLSAQFSRLCARLKITDRSFHSLRHYKATSSYAKMDKEALARKLAASLSLEEIAALLGHQNKNTSKTYLH